MREWTPTPRNWRARWQIFSWPGWLGSVREQSRFAGVGPAAISDPTKELYRMATTTQPAAAEATKQLVNYRNQGGVAIVEMNDPPANTYTYEMNRQLDEAIL